MVKIGDSLKFTLLKIDRLIIPLEYIHIPVSQLFSGSEPLLRILLSRWNEWILILYDLIKSNSNFVMDKKLAMIAYDPDVTLPIAPSVSNKGCATAADINFYPNVIKLICDGYTRQ